MPHSVDGLEADVDWGDYDPTKWRDHPSPESAEYEDDEERPVPEDVFAITGIDPDVEGWD